jgi:hypothetical protein
MTTKLWGLVLGAALTQMACSGGSAETAVAGDPEQAHARLVYTLTINAGHKIDFYEYDFGASGTRETLQVGEAEALRLPDDQPRTLADLFKLVRPGADVPEALQRADERVLASGELTRERLALEPNFLIDLAEREALERRASQGEGGQELAQLSQAAITCSGDFFHDQWGAAWFKQNFGTGFSNNVRCPPAPRNAASFSAQGTITNAFIAEARHPSSRILQWKQMEGDFTNAGSTKGQFVTPGTTTGLVMWNHPVAPRNITVDTLNPGNFGAPEWFVSGVSPCSHLHRTLVWCTAS